MSKILSGREPGEEKREWKEGDLEPMHTKNDTNAKREMRKWRCLLSALQQSDNIMHDHMEELHISL